MLYKFDDDRHGSVVAKEKLESLELYLALHYPESDIPKPARKLFAANSIRIIPDAYSQPVKIFPVNNPISDRPINLTNSILRSATPCHTEYLQAIAFQMTEVETALNRGLGNLRQRINETGAIITHDPLPIVMADSTQMMQLLDEVTFIGKADSGRLGFEVICLDLEAFCRQMFDEVRLIANDKHLTLVFASFGQSDEALWDESLLRHILGNLLSNAIKYSLPGGIVSFELIGQEKAVIFRVQDWGIYDA